MFDLGRKKVLARLPVLGTTGKEVDVGRSAQLEGAELRHGFE